MLRHVDMLARYAARRRYYAGYRLLRCMFAALREVVDARRYADYAITPLRRR